MGSLNVSPLITVVLFSQVNCFPIVVSVSLSMGLVSLG